MTTSGHFLPYGRQLIDDDDVVAVAEALRSEYLTTGPAVAAFEAAFAKATGAKEAVACNSGTAALHLAALAINLQPGDAAIVPTLTFLATANVVRMTGAEVVFADVSAKSGLMTPATFEDAVTRARKANLKPKAALPVHLCGQICDMRALRAIADCEKMALIEDACHALGVENVGATLHSVAACFSTHPVKAVATGEGGVVATSNSEIAARARLFRNHGMVRDPAQFKNAAMAFDGDAPNAWYYEMYDIGWNYRMPDVLCALGTSQLRKLGAFLRRRIEIAALYDRLLAPLSPVIAPVARDSKPHGWHLYAVLIDFERLGLSRDRVMQLLRAQGVGTQVHYIPVHRQPYYRDRYGEQSLPGADAYYDRCLSIPFFPAMTDDDVHHVAQSLSALIGRA